MRCLWIGNKSTGQKDNKSIEPENTEIRKYRKYKITKNTKTQKHGDIRLRKYKNREEVCLLNL